jgi:hypothetical protein
LTSIPIEARKERPMAAVPIHPALAPGSFLKARLISRVPASGKARTSQPYAVALKL